MSSSYVVFLSVYQVTYSVFNDLQLLLSLIMAVSGFVDVNAEAEAKGGLSIFLEVQLDVCVSCLLWMRQSDLRSSGSITQTHSHRAISPGPAFSP